MKHLQDIITESIFDIEDNLPESKLWFNSFMVSKSKKDFNSLCERLKNELDNDFGRDYKKVFNKTKINRMGKYLCIIRRNDDDKKDEWSVFVSYGNIYKVELCWFRNESRTLLSSMGLHSFISVHQVVNRLSLKEGYYLYELDDKWDEFRKLIINKAK